MIQKLYVTFIVCMDSLVKCDISIVCMYWAMAQHYYCSDLTQPIQVSTVGKLRALMFLTNTIRWKWATRRAVCRCPTIKSQSIISHFNSNTTEANYNRFIECMRQNQGPSIHIFCIHLIYIYIYIYIHIHKAKSTEIPVMCLVSTHV